MRQLSRASAQSESDLNAPRRPHKYSWGVNLRPESPLDEDDQPARAIPSGAFRYHSSARADDSTSRSRRYIKTSATSHSPSTPSAAKRRGGHRPSMPRQWGSARVRRGGNEWEPTRKHLELWEPRGEVSVYLYARGDLPRGPSFRLYHEDLIQARCDPLLSLLTSSPSYSSPDDTSSPSSNLATLDLYLPAPVELSKQDAVRWHLSTRNFFAWLMHRPLTLHNALLGETLVELLIRMSLFRAEDMHNAVDLLHYAEEMGYTRTANNPDNAAAMLFVSEYCEREDIWLDAFVHCVGMADRLPACSEYESIGQVTRALITRAYLEMDLHLGRATKGLATLMEGELRSLQLAKPETSCLEQFRSFLHSYCVGMYGYWPPPRDGPFDNRLYQRLREELEDLYHYLADEANGSGTQIVSGNVPVGMHIKSFNTRNKFASLPYTYPLIPRLDADLGRTSGQRSLLSFKIGRSESKSQRAESAMFALHAASNNQDKHLVSAPLVQAYRRFEEEAYAEQDPNVTIADSRRVQWLLIYSMLQMVLSITQVPPEVRDIQSPDYPLCCLTTGLPNWKSKSRETTQGSAAKTTEPKEHHVSASQDLFTPPLTDSEPMSRQVSADDDVNQKSGGESIDNVDISPSANQVQGASSSHMSGHTSSLGTRGNEAGFSHESEESDDSQTTPRIPDSRSKAVSQLDPAVVAAILSGGTSAAIDLVKSAAGLKITDHSDISDSDEGQSKSVSPRLQTLVVPQRPRYKQRTLSNSAGDRSPLLSAEQLSTSPSFAPLDHLAFTIERPYKQHNTTSEVDLRTGRIDDRPRSRSSKHGSSDSPFGKKADSTSTGFFKNMFGRRRSGSAPRRDSPELIILDSTSAAPAPPVKRTPQSGRTLTLHRRPDTAPGDPVFDDEGDATYVDFHDALHVHRE